MADPNSAALRLVRPGETYEGRQGFTYGAGVSADTVGSRTLCMNVLPMAPGARAKAHHHDGIETAAYLLSGECYVYFGPGLEQRVLARAGDHTFIPGGVPHAPCNASGEPCVWLVAHASGSDQDGIVLLPELDLVLERKHPR